MKILVALLAIGGLGYVVYAQHERLTVLEENQAQDDAQMSALQTKLSQVQAQFAQDVASKAPDQPRFSSTLDYSHPKEQKRAYDSLLGQNHHNLLDR